MPPLDSELLPIEVPPESSAPFQRGDWQVAGQYAHSPGRPAGYETFEVYLTNRGKGTKRLASALLDGMNLPPLEAMPRVASLSVSMEGTDVALNPVPAPARDTLTWWQFYPSPEAAPGQTVVFQANFRRTPTSRHRIEIMDSEGELVEVTVPRFREPPARLTAVTYTRDMGRVFVQWQATGLRPARLWLNGVRIRDLSVLASPEPGLPEMAAFTAPFRLKTGMPLYIRADFGGGKWRHAVVRVLAGVSLSAPFDAARPASRDRRAMLLDGRPPVEMLSPDVACGDVKLRDEGGSAAAVIAERAGLFAKSPKRLSAVAYCTAMYPGLWSIYGQMADAVYAKPYSLGFGPTPARFFEEEEQCVAKARDTAAPRPFLWIPDRVRRQRFLEPPELEALGWTMLAKGAKGIRYNFWRNPGPDVFQGDRTVIPGIQALDGEIRAQEERLSPLAPESERTVGDEKAGWIKVYTAWAGDLGLLVLVRNLDYRTDDKDNGAGEKPRFHATEKAGVAFDLALPEWLAYAGVEDLLTGEKIGAEKSGPRVAVRLDQLDAVRVLWIGNGGKEP